MDKISVKVIPKYKEIIQGIDINPLPVLFDIISKKASDKIINNRKPMNISVVLDRSGSMHGSKLENSKKAIKKLMKILSKKDRLHIILYDDETEVLIENYKKTNEDEFINRIDEINAGNTTNLYGAIKKGTDLLEKNKRGNEIKTIFLFSDGLANIGITNNEEIGKKVKQIVNEKNIRFTTFGIGNDFDEKLMSSIARCGKGNYFYIDNMERIPEIVQKSYYGFINIAENLQLKVRGLYGVNVKGIYDNNSTNIIEGKKWDKMRELGHYQVLVNIDINSSIPHHKKLSNNSDKITQSILEWKLEFKDVENNQINILEDKVEIDFINNFHEMKIEPEVKCYEIILECGKLNEKAMNELKKNNINKAIKIKEKIIKKYKEILNEHTNKLYLLLFFYLKKKKHSII